MGGMKCCYYGCKRDRRKYRPGNAENISFSSFPKPHIDLKKCKMWISLCCLSEDADKFFSKIDRNTYICSEHFVGGKGPTDEHPDPIKTFQEFQASQTSLDSSNITITAPPGWLYECTANGNYIYHKKREEHIVLSCDISPDCSFKLEILGSPVTDRIIEMLPEIKRPTDIPTLLNSLEKLRICRGSSNDKNYITTFYARKSPSGRFDPVTKTIYSVHCGQVVALNRCKNCQEYKHMLCVRMAKIKNKPKAINSFSREELVDKVRLLEVEKKALRQQVCRLKEKILKMNLKSVKFKYVKPAETIIGWP